MPMTASVLAAEPLRDRDAPGRAAARSGGAPGWLAPALVAVVAFAVYAQTLVYDFTYDDVGVVQSRALFHSLANWREILGATWWPRALYRPLSALTVAANWQLSGGDPHAFHAVNVAFHVAATLLVFALARRLLGGAAGLVAGLLFAVHPVHVEAVANVVGRLEVLAAIFSLAAVLCYATDGELAAAGDHRSTRRWLATIGTLGCTVLALASKESAFALPGLLLITDWLAARRRGVPFDGAVRPHWLLWIGVVVVTLGWLTWRSTIVSDLTGLEVAPGLEDLGLVGRTVAMLPVVPHYVRLLWFPARLSADYSPPFLTLATHLSAPALGGIAVLAVATAVAIVARRRAPVVTYGLAWIAGTVFIVSNIIAPTGVTLAERTLYLPSVGAVLVAGWGWRWLHARLPAVAVAAALLAVALGGLRTVTRNPVWRNNDVFFPAMIADAPGSFRSDWTQAMLLAKQGNTWRAELLMRRAIAAQPLAPGLWRDLARQLHAMKRYPEAAEYFWTAWTLDKGQLLDAQRAVQNSLLAGAVDTAAARLARAQALFPESLELKMSAADVALARGKPLRAMTLRRQVAWALPDSVRYWALTADAAILAHFCPEVRRSTDRVRGLDPAFPQLHGLDSAATALGCR
jgi:hypothetical protein